MERILQFSTNYVDTKQGLDIIESSVALTKESMNYSKGTPKSEDYMKRNAIFKEALLQYAIDCCPQVANSTLDIKTDMGFKKALNTYSNFKEVMFAVISETVQRANSKVELQAILPFCEIHNLSDGDSMNFQLQPNNIIEFEAVGYSNNSTRHQFQLNSNEVLIPKRVEASVGCDLYQFNAGFFDWGQMVADVLVGLRRYIQLQATSLLFDETDLVGTPFLNQTFTKGTWVALAEKLKTINSAQTVAYGTMGGFSKITENLDPRFFTDTTATKVLETGVINNVFGVKGIILDQAVNTNLVDYPFVLPEDKILLCSSVDRMIKILMEGSIFVKEDDGRLNPVQGKSFSVATSLDMKKVSSQMHGLQLL